MEKLVAERLSRIFAFSYARLDSGSGKFRKEDVTLPEDIPLHIECKNHASLSLNEWWKDALHGCPAYKVPVLVYKINFYEPQVYMMLADLLWILGFKEAKDNSKFASHITISFNDFSDLLSATYRKD